MPKLISGALGRRMIGVLATAFVMAFAGPALAETSGSSAAAAQVAGQGMGPMKQQMMQQMQQCMDQMGPMNGTDQNAMRHQMMARMHSCMESMISAGRSPFYVNPLTVLTPHFAGITCMDSTVNSLIDNLRRELAVQLLVGGIDRSRG